MFILQDSTGSALLTLPAVSSRTPFCSFCSTHSSLLPGFHTRRAFFCHRAFAHALSSSWSALSSSLSLVNSYSTQASLPLGSQIPLP